MPKGNNNNSTTGLSSIGVKVPSFLTVTNSPITSSGTIEIDYNHTPLPISSGGTGLTAIGSKGQILSVISNDPEQLGWVSGSGIGTVTSVSMSVPSFLSVSPDSITSSGTFDISLPEAIPITAGGTGLINLGSANQVLAVNEEGTNLEYKTLDFTIKPINLVTSTPFLSIVTSKESLSIDCETISPSFGGTGLTKLGEPGQYLAVNENGLNLEYKSLKTGIESISISVPSFLSVSPKTITSSGVFDITLSSEPIPINAGGTGLKILGSPSQVLSVDSTGEHLEFKNPNQGTVTSISLSTSTPFLTISPEEITSEGSFSIECLTIPTSHGGTGLSEIGEVNQILTSTGSSLQWTDLPNLENYLTTVETMFPLSFSNKTLSISSYTGLGRVVFENSPILITPILGDATSSSLSLNGKEGGSIKLSSQSGSYNFIFPTSIGKPNQILTSQGPFLPTLWSSTIGSGSIVKAPEFGNEGDILSVISTNPLELGWVSGSGTGTVTSVSMSVPSFLSVKPSEITSSGIFEISLSSESLPFSSGGTGLTTLGLPNQILIVNEDGTSLTYKSLEQSVKSISLKTSTPFLSVSENQVTSEGSLSIDCSIIPTSHGGTGLVELGQAGQILRVNSDRTTLEYTSIDVGVTSVSISVPSFLSVSPTSITSTGIFEISQGQEPIPISYGGTGLGNIGFPNQILSVDSTGQKLEFITPKNGTVTSVSLSTSTPFLSLSSLEITSAGSLSVDCTTVPVSHGGTGLSNPGLKNQILTSTGSSLVWSDPPQLDQYLTTINTIPPLQYSNNTISISAFTGSGQIVFDTFATLSEPTLLDPVVNHVNITGTQSGSVKLSAISGNYNFILPTNYGKPFQVLTAQGPYNPSQWISTTGSGDIVCSKNPILSGQTIFTNGTILCKSKIIQSQGIVTITENTTLTVEQLFSFLIIDSETEIILTLPPVENFNDFIGDYTEGNRISTLIQNKSSNLIFNTSEGIALIDGRSSSSINVQELNYVMKNADTGLLLLK